MKNQEKNMKKQLKFIKK